MKKILGILIIFAVYALEINASGGIGNTDICLTVVCEQGFSPHPITCQCITECEWQFLDTPDPCNVIKGWYSYGTPPNCVCKRCDEPCLYGKRNLTSCKCPTTCQELYSHLSDPCNAPGGYFLDGDILNCRCKCFPERTPCPDGSKRDANCECSCNQDLEKSCLYPGTWIPEKCLCDCPWWGYLTCNKNQYWDASICACVCKEPCHDCTEPQRWSRKFCDCRCPNKVAPNFPCAKNRFWNEWSCKCECNQKPRKCCVREYFKIWDEKACNCVCRKPLSCKLPYVWDSYKCACVLKYRDSTQYLSQENENIDLVESQTQDLDEFAIEAAPPSCSIDVVQKYLPDDVPSPITCLDPNEIYACIFAETRCDGWLPWCGVPPCSWRCWCKSPYKRDSNGSCVLNCPLIAVTAETNRTAVS